MDVLISSVELMFKVILVGFLLCVIYWIVDFPRQLHDAKQQKKEPLPTASAAALPPEAGPSMEMEDVPFFLSVKDLVQVLTNDPDFRKDVYDAVREGPIAATTPVGVALYGKDQYSLFFPTDKHKQPGEAGFIYRNREGAKVQARWRKQQGNRQAAEGLAEAIARDPEVLKQVLEEMRRSAEHNT